MIIVFFKFENVDFEVNKLIRDYNIVASYCREENFRHLLRCE